MENNTEVKKVVCSACGADVPEEFAFCPKCGSKIGSEPVKEESPLPAVQTESPKRGLKNKKLIIGIVAAVVVIAIAGGVISSVVENNKLMSTFEGYITEANYEKAIQFLNRNDDNGNFIKKAEKKVIKLYDGYIDSGEIDKAADIFNGIISETYHISAEKTDEITDNVIETIEGLENDFIEEKKTIDEIKTPIEGYKNFDDESIKEKADSAIENAEKISASRLGFKEGNEYYEKKDYGNAIQSYLKVIDTDENYDAAQSKITEIKDIYKKEVFDSLDSLISADKYDEALEKLNSLNELGEDAEVAAKIDTVTKAQEKHKKEEAKKAQTVVVTGVRVYKANRYSSHMAAEVVIKNNTNKVIKNVELVVASYDSNGYAVNIEYPSLYGAEYDHMLRGSMSTINLMPGGSYGKNRYYDSFSSRAAKAHAIVKSVEFVDGSTWENPYYDYWVEDCKDKY